MPSEKYGELFHNDHKRWIVVVVNLIDSCTKCSYLWWDFWGVGLL